MNKKELSYQLNAANAAISHLEEYNEFKLQSPTGSGKTFIISQIIDKYLESDTLNKKPTTFVFIAPSTGGLDYQGYEKISSYINKNWTKGYSTQYIGTSMSKQGNKSYLQNIDYFRPNTCYFFGWQLLKENTNFTKIDSEKNDIYKVISNTKLKDINIVLIIDEAHREVKSNKNDVNTKQIIIKELSPYKVIKVSATLKENNEHPDYIITYDDVREEKAIKQNVIISQLNEKVKGIEDLTEEEQLIVSAIEKQKEVKKAYQKKKLDINPLILIQIPDKVVIDKEINTEDELLKKIELILQKHGYKNGYNYAIWLSNNKTIKDKNEITNNNSPIDILIFKTAIATGWDIPRANILIRIREAKEKSFNIQTLGRILRNPFFKYYDNELIDDAFVFTRDEKYKEFIKEESIVNDENELFIAKRSKVAAKSNFSIYKQILEYKSEYDEEELIDYICNQIIKRDKFKSNFLEYNHPSTHSESIKEKSIDILSGKNQIEKNMNKKMQQSKINFNFPKISLFDLFIKYRSVTKSSMFIQKVLDKLSSKVHLFNKKIKDFYWACCYNYAKSFDIINGNEYSLKELIDYYKQKYLKEYIDTKFEDYHLPEEYKLSREKYNENEWDEINSFNVKLIANKLDSKNEEEFYKEIKNKAHSSGEFHIFRNGTSLKDYYVEYLDEDTKIRKFFPDFILINEKTKKCLIIEGKGGKESTNIDKHTNSKIQKLIEALKNNASKNKYKCDQVVRVSYNKNSDDVIYRECKEKTDEDNIVKLKDIITKLES